MKPRSVSLPVWLLAVALMIGATLVGCVAIAWLTMTYRVTWGMKRASISVSFKADGEPYLTKRISVGSGAYSEEADLHGKPIAPVESGNFAYTGELAADYPQPQRPSWFERIASIADGRHPPAYWYLVHDGLIEGRAYFVGFDSATKGRVGCIGTSGFSPDPIPEAQQFPIRGGRNWLEQELASTTPIQAAAEPYTFELTSGPDQIDPANVYVDGDNKLFEVDLAQRRVRELASMPKPPIWSVALGGRVGKNRATWVLIRGDDAICMLQANGQQRVLPLAPELRGSTLEVVPRGDSAFTVVRFGGRDFQTSMQHMDVFVADNDGRLSDPVSIDVPYTNQAKENPFVYEAPLLLGAPATLAGALAYVRPRELLESSGCHNWHQGRVMAFHEYASYLVITIIAGAVLAGLCYRRQARYAVAPMDRVLWPAFVFLFGLGGWVGYRYCRRWPAVEPCPACHEPAPRDRVTCDSCGREFPLPEPRGTEIFA